MHEKQRNQPLHVGARAVRVDQAHIFRGVYRGSCGGAFPCTLAANTRPAFEGTRHAHNQRHHAQRQGHQHRIVQQRTVRTKQQGRFHQPGERRDRAHPQKHGAVTVTARSIQVPRNVVAVTSDNANRDQATTQAVEETNRLLTRRRTTTQQLIAQIAALRMGNNTHRIATGTQIVQLTIQTRINTLQIARLRAGCRLNQLRRNSLHQSPQLTGTTSQNPTHNTQTEHRRQTRKRTLRSTQRRHKSITESHHSHDRQHQPQRHIHEPSRRTQQVPGTFTPGRAGALIVEAEHQKQRQNRRQPGQMFLQRAVMPGPPEALLKKEAAASDRANRARLRLRQARKLKIRQLDIREIDVRELYLGKLNFRQINLRELHLRKFYLGQLHLRKFNFRQTDSCRFFGPGGFGGFFLHGILFNLRAFLNRASRVLRALNRQRIRQLAVVARRAHLSGRREGIAVRNHLNTNPRGSLLGWGAFGGDSGIRARIQRQQGLHTIRHRLTKIRERLAVILIANTVNQQHRRIMVLTLTVQGTLRMRRSIISQPPLLTIRQRTTLQQMRHLRHASHLL